MSVRVKICGITQVDDAVAAWSAGANAIGLHFWSRSPRALTVPDAKRIAETRPDGGVVVGLFRNASADHIRSIVREIGLNAVQLHGDEAPSECEGFGVPVVKSIRIGGPEDVRIARSYIGRGDVIALLIRPAAPLPLHASVHAHWQLAQAFHDVPAQLVVGGGLKPDNVADAIRISLPYAVDVTSGVEVAAGLKDHTKLRTFIANARQAQSEPRAGIFG